MVRQGARADRETYFNAAFKILAEQGFTDLTAEALCTELGVTRGSFYHHFANMPDFVDGLLAAWEHTFVELIDHWFRMETLDVVESVYFAMGQWPIRAESALRAWAWSNATVAASVRRHDLVWAAASESWLTRIVDDPQRCRILAHLSQSVIVGMMALQRPVDRELVMAVCTELWRSVIGIEFAPEGDRLVPRLTAPPAASAPLSLLADLSSRIETATAPTRPVTPTPTSGDRRVDREAYFNAAFRLLAEVGFQDLTVDALSAELGVTRGSFYHHFAGMPDFVDGLLAAWEATVGSLLDSWASMPPWQAVVHVVGVT